MQINGNNATAPVKGREKGSEGMEQLKILVVDDEVEITDLVGIYLTNEGFEVIKAHDGAEALKLLEEQAFHLVILDVMMPGMGGLEVCREIRRSLNIPILMLTAKSEDMDKILGLGTGADDYLTKPFNPMELVARVKSQIRRYLFLNPAKPLQASDGNIQIDGLLIDPKEHSVTVYGQAVSLTPTEFDILLLLASNRGRVFGAEEIFERVWGERYFGANNTVMVHIRKIREKIEEDPRKPRYIKTVWGVGYKIEKQKD